MSLHSSDTAIVRALFTPFPVAPAFKSISQATNRFSVGRSAIAEANADFKYWG